MQDLSVFWLRAAAALYAVGLFHTLQIAIRKDSGLFRTSLVSFAGGLVLHMVAIVESGLATRTLFPAGFSYSISLCGFLLGLSFLIVYWRYKVESLGVLLFPVVFAMAAIAAVKAPVNSWGSGGARDTWLAIHIVLVLLGYAALLVTAFAALLYLLQERQLKRKQPISLLNRLPALGVLDDLISTSLWFGFILTTVGVITGATWAYIEAGKASLSDPRMSAALLTWSACFLMITLRITAGWRGRKAALMAIAALACSAATWAVHYVYVRH